MIRLQRTKTKSSERGVALIIALLTLLLISAILMGMIVASNSETNISTNFRDEQTAFFAARAGIEEVRDRLRTGANPTLATNAYFAATTTPLAGTANGVLYVINPTNGEAVAPWSSANKYYDDEIIKELGVALTGTGYIIPAPSSAGNSYAATPPLAWKWVRVMIKPNKSDTPNATRVTSVDGQQNANRVCFNGSHEYTTAATTCPDKPVYELTALAVTPSGSRRMVQYEVSQGSFPPIPGAIVFDGPTPSFSPPSSNSFSVSGTDVDHGPPPPNNVPCPAAANVPAMGGYNAAAATALTNDVTRPGSYTSGATATPAISNVSSQLGVLNTVDGLQALVNNVTAAAASNIYGASPLPNPSTLNIGSTASPVINVVQGDYTLSGSTAGSGILLVTGNLTFSGNPTYDGLILVIGQGTVTKNGGGNGTLNGALLVANMFDGSGNPIPLGAGSAPGSPSITWNGGGTASFNYDSCWVNYGSQPLPFRTITDRELIY